jgi:hypothetical protein
VAGEGEPPRMSEHSTKIRKIYQALSKNQAWVHDDQNTILKDNIYTSPAFRINVIRAYKNMQVKYQNGAPVNRSIVGRPGEMKKAKTVKTVMNLSL